MSSASIPASVLLLSFALAAGGSTPDTSEGPTAVPFRGNWRQVDLTGFRSWDDGRCVMQLFQERVYELQPFSQDERQILGTYSSINHGRFVRNADGACRLEGEEEPHLLYANTRVWGLEGKIDQVSGDVRLRATYQTCLNLGCDDPQLSHDDFGTFLRRVDGTMLIDTGASPAGTDDLVFLRINILEARAHDAAAEVERLLLPLVRGELNRFFEESLSDSWRRATPWQATRQLSQQIRPLLTEVESRSLVEARYANRGVFPQAAPGRHYVFVIHRLRLSGGRVALETATLVLENGAWKLAALWY